MIVLRSATHASSYKTRRNKADTAAFEPRDLAHEDLLDLVPIAWAGSAYAVRAAQHVDACASLYRMQQDACELRSLLAPVVSNTEEGGYAARCDSTG